MLIKIVRQRDFFIQNARWIFMLQSVKIFQPMHANLKKPRENTNKTIETNE